MEKDDFDLFSNFLAILKAFQEEKVEYVLIGGFAVILHGLPRLTSDIDIFVRPDSANIDRLKKSLARVFPKDNEIKSISLDDLNEYAVVRYGTEDRFYIDIISRIGEMFKYEDLRYEIREIEGIPVRIATAETLYNMKKDTVRTEDKRDALFLSELIEKNKNKAGDS